MRGLFSKVHPSFERLLVIESGPREVTEKFLRHLYEVQHSRRVDLLTCFENAPEVFDPDRGTLYSIHDPVISALSSTPYTIVAIFCTGSPILAKWKWIIALRTRAKVLIVNEHAGFFLLDYRHRYSAKAMLSQRVGLRGAIHLHLLAELLIVPFTINYLLLYAGAVHARRLLRPKRIANSSK